MRPRSRRIAACLVLPATLAACPGQPITPTTTIVAPHVGTVASMRGVVDVTNDCSTATPPAPPLPSARATSTPPGQGVNVAGRGIVGFELWRNTFDGCTSFRQDTYRTVFTYDLGSLASLKGLVTDASMSFGVAIVPSGAGSASCPAMSAGLGALARLPDGTAAPTVLVDQLAPNAPFPTGSTLMTLPATWSAGTVATGVTTMATGLGGASYTVNLKNPVTGAIDRGASSIAFMLVGTGEAPVTTAPATGTDCKTLYMINPLVITHL